MLDAVPDSLAWTFGVVLAILMLKRGGLKAEKLLLAGCCLMLAVSILSPVIREMIMNLTRGDNISAISFAQAALYIQLPSTVIRLAGFVCLIIAFWIKFRIKKQETL